MHVDWLLLLRKDSRLPKRNKTDLIRAGKTHLAHPSCGGNSNILPPGINIHTESHTSPSTFANEVNTSANTTSEKYIGLVEGGNRHLRIELERAGRERGRFQDR